MSDYQHSIEVMLTIRNHLINELSEIVALYAYENIRVYNSKLVIVCQYSCYINFHDRKTLEYMKKTISPYLIKSYLFDDDLIYIRTNHICPMTYVVSVSTGDIWKFLAKGVIQP